MKAKEELTVKDVIDLIESGEMKVDEIAELFERSDRTVQEKISKVLGFKYDYKACKYEYQGKSDIEDVYAINFNSLFRRKTSEKQNQTQKQNRSKGRSKMDNKSTSESINESNVKIENDSKTENSNVNDFQNTLESLSKLANKKESNGKKYRGFYFSEETLEAIDNNIGNGNKSEFVDTAVKTILKQLGWME